MYIWLIVGKPVVVKVETVMQIKRITAQYYQSQYAAHARYLVLTKHGSRKNQILTIGSRYQPYHVSHVSA